MTLIIESQAKAPVVSARLGVHFSPAAARLWRVIDRTGRVIGHLQQLTDRGETRFRARRFHAPSHGFRDLGDFWNADDAVESLRFTR